MIGDDIVGDVGGAQRYGMRALQVDREVQVSARGSLPPMACLPRGFQGFIFHLQNKGCFSFQM